MKGGIASRTNGAKGIPGPKSMPWKRGRSRRSAHRPGGPILEGMGKSLAAFAREGERGTAVRRTAAKRSPEALGRLDGDVPKWSARRIRYTFGEGIGAKPLKYNGA